MRLLVVVFLVAFAPMTPPTVCRIGTSWQGTPGELAAIEAVYQAQAAHEAGRAFPTGAPTPSPWTGLFSCART